MHTGLIEIAHRLPLHLQTEDRLLRSNSLFLPVCHLWHTYGITSHLFACGFTSASAISTSLPACSLGALICIFMRGLNVYYSIGNSENLFHPCPSTITTSSINAWRPTPIVIQKACRNSSLHVNWRNFFFAEFTNRGFVPVNFQRPSQSNPFS